MYAHTKLTRSSGAASLRSTTIAGSFDSSPRPAAVGGWRESSSNVVPLLSISAWNASKSTLTCTRPEIMSSNIDKISHLRSCCSAETPGTDHHRGSWSNSASQPLFALRDPTLTWPQTHKPTIPDVTITLRTRAASWHYRNRTHRQRVHLGAQQGRRHEVAPLRPPRLHPPLQLLLWRHQ